MQNNSQWLGKKGEALALKYLIEHGYAILETNWRYKRLEVDIIAQKNNTIAFIEVKARSSNQYGEPEEFVNEKKQKFLVDAAHHYLVSQNTAQEARFDIIAITTGNNNTPTVKHLQDAFYPGLN